jgi:hypothetical protein
VSGQVSAALCAGAWGRGHRGRSHRPPVQQRGCRTLPDAAAFGGPTGSARRGGGRGWGAASRARATRRPRRVRSSARASVIAGRTSARRSSPGSRGRCRPWTSPLPAADQRGGHVLEVDPERGPAFLGPDAQLHGQVGGEDQLAGLPVGMPGRQLIDQAAGGLGHGRVQQPAGRHYQHPTRPIFMLLLGGQGEAEVAVDPAGLDRLPEGVGAKLAHQPGSSHGWAGAPGYPPDRAVPEEPGGGSAGRAQHRKGVGD